MKNINGVHVTVKKGDLAQLNDGQLKIICVFPHVLNKLKILESQVYSHMNVALDTSREKVRREMAICAFLESIILIAGELKEAWDAIQQCYYGTKVSKTMNASLPQDIQDRLKRLSGHFTGDSLVSFLRNNFAYHNSPDKAMEAIKLFDDEDTLAFYIIEDNNYFDYAGKVRIAAIAERLGLDDWNRIFTPLMETIMGQVFNDLYLPMIVIANNILLTLKQVRATVALKDVPDDSELRADVFSYMSIEKS